MPAPPALKKKLIAQLNGTLETLIDSVWDGASKAAMADAAVRLQEAFSRSGLAVAAINAFGAPEPVRDLLSGQQKIDFGPEEVMSPQKRGAQNRAPKGLIKGTIKDLIYNAGPEGITAAQIRDIAQLQKGVTIKEGSMKQGLRLLQLDKAIERRGINYFPTENGGQSHD